MQINQLPIIPQAPADADVLAIEVNGVTYKVSKSVLTSAILASLSTDSTPTEGSTKPVQSGGVYAAITEFIPKSDVVNNLTSGGTTVPLSAEMGKTLMNLFSPTVNTNITLSGNWTSLQGGYYKIGKIVIVQLSAVYSGSFPANDYFTLTQSLPKPDTLTSFAVTTNTNDAKGAEAIMGIDRILKIKSGSTALTDQRVIVSGIYIAES